MTNQGFQEGLSRGKGQAQGEEKRLYKSLKRLLSQEDFMERPLKLI